MWLKPAMTDKEKGTTHKLRPRWKGPYEAVVRTTEVNYKIRAIGSKSGPWRRMFVIHASRLKPVHRLVQNGEPYDNHDVQHDVGEEGRKQE